MEPTRFDELTKVLATPTSRRQALTVAPSASCPETVAGWRDPRFLHRPRAAMILLTREPEQAFAGRPMAMD